MVEHKLPKLDTRVRFPSPALGQSHASPDTQSGVFLSTRLARPKPPIFTLSRAGDWRYTSPPLSDAGSRLTGRGSCRSHAFPLAHPDNRSDDLLRSCLHLLSYLPSVPRWPTVPTRWWSVHRHSWTRCVRGSRYRAAQGHRFAFVPSTLERRADPRGHSRARQDGRSEIHRPGGRCRADRPRAIRDCARAACPRSWPPPKSTCAGSRRRKSRPTTGTPTWTMTASRNWPSVACPRTVRRT